MNLHRRHLLAAAGPLTLLGLRAWAQAAPDAPAAESRTAAAQHVARAWALYRQGVATEEEQMQVHLTRAGQPTETKALTRWSRLSPEGDQVVVRFSAPAADRGLGLLILRSGATNAHSTTGGQPGSRQVWLRQPSWGQARRIAADREGRPFGDTDLTFEDNRQLLGEAVADFHYRLLPQQDPGWLVEARPRDGIPTAYGMRHIRLTPQHAVAEIRYFDPQLRPLKTQRHDGLEVDASGRWRARTVTIEHHQDRSQTVLELTRRLLNPPLADRVFTPGFLTEP